jgi:TRAP-type C4-dicarboxylate transport system substrate-binding protein
MVNLNKWKQLKPETQALLSRAGLEADKNVFKKQTEMDARYKKEQADAGVQVITLQGAEREKYIKTAYDAGWAELEQLDAENTKKLKPLLSK